MRRLAASILALTLAACGGSPTSPAPGGAAPVPTSLNFDGVWNLEYKLTECTGERHCVDFIGHTYKFSVRLLSAGAFYDGVAMLPTVNVDVSGSIDGAGALVLAGSRLAPVATTRDQDITRLRLQWNGGTLDGDIALESRGESNPAFSSRAFRKGTIVSATRVAEIAGTGLGDFTGSWKGRVLTRDCTATGAPRCSGLDPRELWDFDLSLSGGSARVTGLFARPTRANVEGSVSGATIVLRGSGTSASSGLTTTITVRDSSLTRDLVGRLKGSLSIEMRSLWTDGRVSTSDFRAIELIDVVLAPPGR